MEKDEQLQRFYELCASSSFPHKEELLKGIKSGDCSLKSSSNSQVLAEELARNYKIKLESAKRHNSRHAQRLVSDTLKFIDELEKNPNDKVNFWHFSLGEPSGFTVFEGINSQKILGCILTVDKRKVSESEWEKLWNE